MHISKLRLINYRNFANATLTFKKGVNTIIGENGSGKTNLFRAIRLMLDGSMLRAAHSLDESDFHRGLGDWRGHWIIISLEFEDIGPDEAIQALFQHGAANLAGGPVATATYNLIFRPNKETRLRLAGVPDWDVAELQAVREQVTIADYETVFTGRSAADLNDPAIYRTLVGDFDSCSFPKEIDEALTGARLPVYLSVAREVAFTFIQALRDVVDEFRNNRTNPLLTLLKAKSGAIDPAVMQPVVAKVLELNTLIEGLQEVQTVRSDIRSTIQGAAGETYAPASLSIKSELSDEADKLFQSLRLFVGESDDAYEGGIHELSLGGANLIFLTLKLLEFQYLQAGRAIANFLVIEEPEAHIHTHIQKTLFDRIGYADTQIIYSTHSTQISEVSNIERVNILGREGGACQAFHPTSGLDQDIVGSLERYLDAVRSNLLFAKSVVLIEGDAEEILIPVLFKKVMGLSLDELGISLINIRSTGFKNVAVLFAQERIRKRCAIITDRDAAILDTTPIVGEPPQTAAFKRRCAASDVDGARRQLDLNGFTVGNPWLSVHYASHTFEVDFIAAGNAEVAKKLVTDVYKDPATIALAENQIESPLKELYGRRILTMAKDQGKGWFAILLSKKIDCSTVIPSYISDAVFFSRPTLSKELFINIYRHRVNCAVSNGKLQAEIAYFAISQMDAYRAGQLDLPGLKAAMAHSVAGDQVHAMLAAVQ